MTAYSIAVAPSSAERKRWTAARERDRRMMCRVGMSRSYSSDIRCEISGTSAGGIS
jgi:hypothetical protein